LSPYLEDGFPSVGRRQDSTELYYFEGTLYLSDIPALLERKSFYHTRTLPYIVPKWKSFEIDDIVDFICLETLFAKRTMIEEK